MAFSSLFRVHLIAISKAHLDTCTRSRLQAQGPPPSVASSVRGRRLQRRRERIGGGRRHIQCDWAGNSTCFNFNATYSDPSTISDLGGMLLPTWQVPPQVAIDVACQSTAL